MSAPTTNRPTMSETELRFARDIAAQRGGSAQHGAIVAQASLLLEARAQLAGGASAEDVLAALMQQMESAVLRAA